jgi:lysophospholipase L1-like esterase
MIALTSSQFEGIAMPSQSLLSAAVLGLILSTGALTGCAYAPAAPKPHDGRWVASWGSAQMAPGAQDELPAPQWRDATLRQIVHVSLGARLVRVRVSNAFGTQPLTLDSASLALAAAPGRGDVDRDSIRPLRFDGRAAVTIPAGAEYASDPVELPHAAGADLAVSMHFSNEPAHQTGHPGARATSFIARGDHVLEAQWTQSENLTRWFQLAAIEVLAAPGVHGVHGAHGAHSAHSVVAIGDSITDGYGATTDGNDRWTDALSARLRAAGMPDIGVVNAGIGGGRLLRDGLGPNLVSRFERDVLARAGVTHAIVMIGVNDLAVQHRNQEDTPAARLQLLDELKGAHRQLVERAHARGVCVLGATITPYAGSAYYKPNADNERDRQTYNGWIRNAGVFDGVVDFDAALRDPARPDQLLKAYDNDGLHPTLAGYKAMADAVPLAQLRTCSRAASMAGRL